MGKTSQTRRATRRPPARSGGWMLVEVFVALAVLAVVLSCLAASQQQVRKFNSLQLLQQHAVAAAAAQLDSLAATGRPIAEAEMKRLWPGIEVQFAQSPGEGDWAGLTLLKVAARGAAYGMERKVVLCRYIAARELR